MHRIHRVSLPFSSSTSISCESRRFEFPDEFPNPLHHCFIPLHYEQNYAYPLLIWLHGPTGCEREINHVMPHISLRNYVAISPRGGVRDARQGYSWDQSPACVEQATNDVLDCLEIAKTRFNIAPARVFLVGNDTGGTMALRLALRMPSLFAGVASIGGRLPDDNCPLAAIERARSLPVMVAQGRDSHVFSTNRVCEDLKLLHAAGISVTLRQYPCEQDVTTQMLSDLNVWIMEQAVGPTSAPESQTDSTWLRMEDRN